MGRGEVRSRRELFGWGRIGAGRRGNCLGQLEVFAVGTDKEFVRWQIPWHLHLKQLSQGSFAFRKGAIPALILYKYIYGSKLKCSRLPLTSDRVVPACLLPLARSKIYCENFIPATAAKICSCLPLTPGSVGGGGSFVIVHIGTSPIQMSPT